MRNFASKLARAAALCVMSWTVSTVANADDYRKIVHHQVVYKSPDRRTRAVVVRYRPCLYADGEGRVDIRDGRGRLIASEDYSQKL